MSCETIAFYIGTTSFVDFLFVDEDGARVDDATVEVTVYDEDDAEATGAVWPIVADALVDNDDYNYRAVLPAGLGIEKNERGRVHISAVNPANNYQIEADRIMVGTPA